MSATLSDRELLQQLRDALVRSNNALNVLTATNHQHDAEIIAAVDARLSEPEWISVEERLPVVPKAGQEVWLHGDFTDKFWLYPDAKLEKRWTHWRYAEPIPKLPKDNP